MRASPRSGSTGRSFTRIPGRSGVGSPKRVRALFRPILTMALWGLSIFVFRQIVSAFGGEANVLAQVFTNAEINEIMKYMVYTVFFCASTATTWWFGDRAFTPPGMGEVVPWNGFFFCSRPERPRGGSTAPTAGSAGYAPTGVRNLLIASVAFAGAWAAGGAWWLQVVAAVASLSVIIGWTDWGRWWMALRFGLPPLAALFGLWAAGEMLAVPLPGFDGGNAVLYVALCAAAGGCYPLLFWFHDERRITSWNPGDGPEWWARCLSVQPSLVACLCFLFEIRTLRQPGQSYQTGQIRPRNQIKAP